MAWWVGLRTKRGPIWEQCRTVWHTLLQYGLLHCLCHAPRAKCVQVQPLLATPSMLHCVWVYTHMFHVMRHEPGCVVYFVRSGYKLYSD